MYFNEIKEEEIEWYVNNEEKIFKCCSFVPLGKASLFIDKIEGDYNTLLGISPSIIYNKLKELGYSVTDLDFEKKELIKMDIYQKRKMRAEKKNNGSQESFSKVSISW